MIWQHSYQCTSTSHYCTSKVNKLHNLAEELVMINMNKMNYTFVIFLLGLFYYIAFNIVLMLKTLSLAQ